MGFADLFEPFVIDTRCISHFKVSGTFQGGETRQQNLCACGFRDRVETTALQLSKESEPDRSRDPTMSDAQQHSALSKATAMLVVL